MRKLLLRRKDISNSQAKIFCERLPGQISFANGAMKLSLDFSSRKEAQKLFVDLIEAAEMCKLYCQLHGVFKWGLK